MRDSLGFSKQLQLRVPRRHGLCSLVHLHQSSLPLRLWQPVCRSAQPDARALRRFSPHCMVGDDKESATKPLAATATKPVTAAASSAQPAVAAAAAQPQPATAEPAAAGAAQSAAA